MEGVDYYCFTLLCTHSIKRRMEIPAPLREAVLLSFVHHRLFSRHH